MTLAHHLPFHACLLLLMLVTGTARGTPHTVPQPASAASAGARVTVTYVKPHQFTESRLAGFGHRYDHGDYLEHLKVFLIRKATPMLQPGQHLSIAIIDIDLAGGYEPWLGPQWNDVRFMRDVYPPRFDLRFRLTGPDGHVIRKGTRTLNGLGYLHDTPVGPGDTDPLRYDKALLERWLRRGPGHW